MLAPFSPQQNQLLAALPPEDYEYLLPHLKLVSMSLGYSFRESDNFLKYACFPVTSIASLVSILSDGTSVEFAIVGNDGIIGTPLFTGGATISSNHAIILNPGYGYRLEGSILAQAFNHSDAIRHVLLHYTQVLIFQIAQTAACNRHHSLENQLCRLLLLILDRLLSNKIDMTQEQIANVLGVRREGVTEVAGRLQRAGIIQYSRGHINVLDRPKLETLVCECYQVVKSCSEKLLPIMNTA